MGKSKQQAHSKTTDHSNITAPFHIVYTDLMRAIDPVARGGFRYVSKFTNQHSKWKEIYLLNSEADAVDSLQYFLTKVAIPRKLRLKRLRADRGTEYTAGYFKKFCGDTGIIHEFAATVTSQQVGVSERDGRTLTNVARCLLKDGGFPDTPWGEMPLPQDTTSTGHPTRDWTDQPLSNSSSTRKSLCLTCGR